MINNKNNNWNNLKKIAAFTLAEVLITLGIIGVVAALTIPTLMQNSQNQGFVSGMKKGFSVLSQANSALIAESGSLMAAVSSYGNLTNALASKLKIMKNCPKTQNPGECFTMNIKNLPGAALTEILYSEGKMPDLYNRFVLADGSTIVVGDAWNSDTCDWNFLGHGNSCGIVILDVNGLKQPNQLGRDIYFFYFYADGTLKPGGGNGLWDDKGDDSYIGYSDYWTYCNPNYGGNAATAGLACAGRILKDGGMKY